MSWSSHAEPAQVVPSSAAAESRQDGGRGRRDTAEMSEDESRANALHVLVLPSWFSEPNCQFQGIFFLDQALALQRAGHRVGIIYPARHSWRGFNSSALQESSWAEPFQPELEIMRARRLHLPKAGPINGALFALQALRLFRRYRAMCGSPDVVHVQGSLWGALGGALIQRVCGVPFVVTEHASVFLHGRLAAWNAWTIRRSLERASGIAAVSHALAQSLSMSVTTRPIQVVANTVDADYFQRRAPRPPARAFTLLTMGSLVRGKRLDRTIRAFAQAFGDDPQARLEIGGDGSERTRLEQLAAELGMQHKIAFLGELQRHEVRAAMQRADLFVLTSERETFSVVLIEALASGLPVVAMRAGGPEEIVSSEVGYLVDQNDQAGLVAALAEARARQTREGAAWSECCADYAKRHYGYAIFAAQLSRMLRSALLAR